MPAGYSDDRGIPVNNTVKAALILQYYGPCRVPECPVKQGDLHHTAMCRGIENCGRRRLSALDD